MSRDAINSKALTVFEAHLFFYGDRRPEEVLPGMFDLDDWKDMDVDGRSRDATVLYQLVE